MEYSRSTERESRTKSYEPEPAKGIFCLPPFFSPEYFPPLGPFASKRGGEGGKYDIVVVSLMAVTASINTTSTGYFGLKSQKRNQRWWKLQGIFGIILKLNLGSVAKHIKWEIVT